MTAIRALAIAGVLGACGDNLPPPEPPPDCSLLAQPATGFSLDAAREAYRRYALRQRLRYREATEPGYVLRETALIADPVRIARGLVCPQELFEVGRILFEHGYTFADGLAAGPSATPFKRVQRDRHGGPETTSCVSCHWQRGPGGGGGLPDASFLLGDGDRVSSADARNPPALAGAGVVEALAAEMTATLAALRDDAIARARRTRTRTTAALVAKGVSFGELIVEPDGRVDTDGIRGVDPDLVVRPFGWKGSAATLVEFVTEAAALHLGIQSTDAGETRVPLELGGGPPEDPDEDGIADELTAGQIIALAVYIASLDTPVVRPHEVPADRDDPAGPTQPYLVDEWARGRTVFDQIGCAGCHEPMMVLNDPALRVRSLAAEASVTIDLARDGEAPRIAYDPTVEGYPVPVFSDFKRHDLGDANASTHLHNGIGRRLYLTRRLWGLRDSAPYFHDGKAMTVDAAIARHGGEAAAARAGWEQLPEADRSALRIFLASLRRGPRLLVP